ncbi:MAG: TIGR01906 family membrane protein, partial [Lachnospiraceae bacterium]|nr:TIGR01906 family membrane protein [Lachnospiraceae bacterium]
VVNGQKREFFNEREITHMEDVQKLFVAGMNLRVAALIIMIGLSALLVILKTSWKRILPKVFQYTTVALGVVTIGLVALFASDFNTYFTKFHEMFFSNDLWVLDPATSLLINMLPEGFFVDIASRVGIVFGVLLIISFAAATLWRIKPKKKHKIFK